MGKKKKTPGQAPDTAEVKIRRAEATDAVRIYHILKKHIAKDLPHLPPPNAHDTMQWILETIRGGLVMVADMDGALIGSIAGAPAVWPHSRAVPYFHGQWYFVLPGYGEAKVGAALVKKARSLANLKLIDMVFFMFGTDVEDEKERLMRQEGFTDCGGVLMLKAVRESEETVMVQVQEA